MERVVPTLRMGTSCERLMASWKKLKKSLNWLKSTRGRKLKRLYFWLLTALEIVFVGSLRPSIHTFRYTFISYPRQHPQHIQRHRHPQHPALRLKGTPAPPIYDSDVQSLSLLRPVSPYNEPSSDGLRSCISYTF